MDHPHQTKEQIQQSIINLETEDRIMPNEKLKENIGKYKDKLKNHDKKPEDDAKRKRA